MAKKKEDKFSKQDEQLQEVNNALTGAGQWIEKHSKALTIGVTVIVLIILGIFAYKQFVIEPRHRAATKENGENYMALVIASQQPQTTPEEQAAVLDEIRSIADGFAATADKYDNKEGNFAALSAGITYVQAGAYEDAISYLEKYEGEDMHFRAAAKHLQGDCYVMLGDLDAAISAYDAAAATGHEVYAPMSLRRAGFAYLKLGNKAGAHEMFAAIKKHYPASVEAQDIDKWIAYTAE